MNDVQAKAKVMSEYKKLMAEGRAKFATTKDFAEHIGMSDEETVLAMQGEKLVTHDALAKLVALVDCNVLRGIAIVIGFSKFYPSLIPAESISMEPELLEKSLDKLATLFDNSKSEPRKERCDYLFNVGITPGEYLRDFFDGSDKGIAKLTQTVMLMHRFFYDMDEIPKDFQKHLRKQLNIIISEALDIEAVKDELTKMSDEAIEQDKKQAAKRFS